MMKKRSIGVTAFSLLILGSSIFSLLKYEAALEIAHPISNYFYLIIFSVSIGVAIYLLKLRKWARIAIIVISILVMMESLAMLSYTANRSQKYFSKTFEEGYKRLDDKTEMENEKKAFLSLMNILMAIFILVSLGFNCGVIYFFTRPKIKEQFE